MMFSNIQWIVELIVAHSLISTTMLISTELLPLTFLAYLLIAVVFGYNVGMRTVIPSTIISSLLFGTVIATNWSEQFLPSIGAFMLYLVLSAFIYRVFSDLSHVAEKSTALEKSATIDTMTGLYNRDKMNEWLAAAHKSGRNVGVLFVDIDNFKAINDQYGHQIGDEVLINIGERLLNSVRRQDVVCRIGGDEFVVLIDDESHIIIEQIASRIGRELNTPFTSKGIFGISATGSIGVAVLGVDGMTVEDTLRDADAAMYKAKRRGRNRIVWYGDTKGNETI